MNINNRLIKLLLCLASLILTGSLVSEMVLYNHNPGGDATAGTSGLVILDRFDMQMTNTLSSALDGILSIKKIYWLSDDDLQAPEPNQTKYGTTNDPSTLDWLLEEAADILDGQETYFTPEIQIIKGTQVTYYLDETILAITWKEAINGRTFTISEVKVADASQFRRFLAGGEFGSSKQLTTTEMATSVNAVVAMSGDFYKHRRMGVVVYDETLMRFDGRSLDTCYIDDKGDMLFTYREELKTKEDAEKFIEENNVRFSIAFGPVLIDNGEAKSYYSYAVGESDGNFARAGIGQKGELHYIMTTVNNEFFGRVPNIWQFTDAVSRFGCDKFYTLDGGQTATLVMNDEVINRVDYGAERKISDIIYFATAIPDGRE